MPTPYRPQDISAAAGSLVLYTEEGTYFGRSWAGGTENLTCSSGVTVVKNAAPARAATMLGIPSLVGAHVRVVHSPDSQSRSHVESLRTANERELLVHYTMESPQMWPADLDAAYMASFDLRWSYNTRLSSAPSVYHDGGKLARRVRRPVHRVGWRSKVRGRLLTTAVSNCEDFVGRAEYVRALQREMGGEFINVGRCSGSELSAEQQAEIQSKKRGGFDRFVARGYFYLALENANCEGYITEKLGRALVAGVVPVVFDARLPSGGPRRPDYSTLLPPGSYVNVADFASPAALASHLRAVAANQTAYTAHLWAHNLNASQVRSPAARRPPARRVTPRPAFSLPKPPFPPQLHARWPQHQPGSAKNEEKRPECCLAAAALEALGTARRSGTRPPRLAPDRSCLPPRQLCRHLPRGTCTPAEEPTRPVTRSSPAYGRRSAVHIL